MRKPLLTALALALVGGIAAADKPTPQEKDAYCKKLRFIAEKAAKAQWRGVSEAEFRAKLEEILAEEGVSPRGIREAKAVVRDAYEADDDPAKVAEQAWINCQETLGEE